MSILKKASSVSLLLLIGADIPFIVLHLLHTFIQYPGEIRFSIEMDRGYSEVFQYLKEYWIAIMFCWLGFIKREWFYFAWSLLFVYLLADDSLVLHERLGAKVAEHFSYHPFLLIPAHDLGELSVFVISGAILFAIIGVAYYYGTADFRSVSRIMIKLTLLLVYFGVVIDMLHVMIDESSIIYTLAGVIEDGGEMFVMSVICWYVLRLLYEAKTFPSVKTSLTSQL